MEKYTYNKFDYNSSVLEQLHGKTLVMSLLSHADHNVRYEALLAVQKLMVHNWYVMYLKKCRTHTGCPI